MLNGIHTAISNLNGFIQSDKRCLQTENGHNVSEGLKVFLQFYSNLQPLFYSKAKQSLKKKR